MVAAETVNCFKASLDKFIKHKSKWDLFVCLTAHQQLRLLEPGQRAFSILAAHIDHLRQDSMSPLAGIAISRLLRQADFGCGGILFPSPLPTRGMVCITEEIITFMNTTILVMIHNLLISILTTLQFF